MNMSLKQNPIKSYITLWLILLMSSSSFAQIIFYESNGPKRDGQEHFTISGEVRDKVTSGQMVGANLRVFNSADSLVGEGKAENYTWSEIENTIVKDSSFHIPIPHIKDIYTIEVGYEDYDTLYHTLNLRDMGRREFSRNIGTLKIQRPREEQLKEVTVTASKVKFYNRGDTVVYNASAFQLADGSMLDALIKQLPGVELQSGGQIYVNGEYVEELLLNGKDFFKGDNQVMLDNLAAYAVQNVEVYKKTTDENEFIGNNAESAKKLVMDVKIKKEYIGGWNFNFEVGAGSEERYMARLFGMHFTATKQFSLYANVNNLNDSRSPNSDSEWNPAYRPEGTKDFKEAGFSYSIEQESKSKQTGSLVVRSMQSRYNDGVNTTNFLPMGNNYQYSTSSRRQHDFYFFTDHAFVKRTNSIMLSVSPQLGYRQGKTWSVSESSSVNTELSRDTALVYGRRLIAGTLPEVKRQQMINASLNDAYNSDYHFNATVRSYMTVKIPRTSDVVGASLDYSFNNDRLNNQSDYRISYGDPSVTPMARRQQQKVSPNQTNNIEGRVFYRFSFAHESALEVAYGVNYKHEKKNSAFYIGQLEALVTGDYTIPTLSSSAMTLDPSNSYYSLNDQLQQALSVRLILTCGAFSFYLNPELGFYNNKLEYTQADQVSTPKFKKALGEFFGDIDYSNEGRTTTFSLSMRVIPSAPNLMDMITPVNTSDPLNVYLGNPDLKASYRYLPSIGFSKRKNGIYNLYFYVGGQFASNSITKGYVYDNTTGVRYHKSYNVDGNLSGWVRAGYSLKFFKVFNLNSRLNYQYSRTYDMIGENDMTPQKSRMNNQTLSPEVQLAYEPNSKYKVELTYEPSWQWAHNQRGTSFDIREDHIGLHFTGNLPYNWSIRTGMDMFGRNGYGDKDMDTTDWIWNLRVAKSFQKGKWLLAVDAYDLLHQMSAITYSISPQCRIEKFTNTIPRYILFHVQYRLNIMPKKDSVKKAEKVSWW